MKKPDFTGKAGLLTSVIRRMLASMSDREVFEAEFFGYRVGDFAE
jgi:hypothetical protein